MKSLSLPDIRTNILSGITVALALVPEAIAFALLAGFTDVKIGLYAAFIVCIVTTVLGGRPGMISGATGAMAVVIYLLVNTVKELPDYSPGLELEFVFLTVIVTGIIQLIVGAFRLGKFIRLVPYPVMLGFVNGLAIVIFLAQFNLFKVDGQWLPTDQLKIMSGLVILSLAIIYLCMHFIKSFPAPLISIIVVSALVIFADIDTRTVGDLGSIAGGLPIFHIPNISLLSEFNYAIIIIKFGFILAAIGLIESLLTLNLIDEMTDTRGQPNRECVGQGSSNIIAGLFGSMGGCAMIGQSMININNGAYKRLSGVCAAFALLSFILFGSEIIEKIPLAVLIADMFFVAERTFEWGSLRVFKNIPKEDYLVIIGVTLITVLTHNLAVAVISGVIFSALVFAWSHAKEIHITSEETDESHRTYHIKGTLFFASISQFNQLFTPANDPKDVVIDFLHAKVIDHSALVAIDNLAERYSNLNKTLHLRHLSSDCKELLSKAKGMVEINILEDPKYHPADDRLG
jgi:sulfate permease, SulP family